jgi:peptide/nickel transport system permease protein
MLTGGFGGKSLASGQPITDMIARQFPVTLLLAFYASVLSVVIAVPFAAVSALRWNRWHDYLIRLITIPGQAIPNFLLALLLLLGLVLLIGWSPPIIYTNPWENPLNHFQIMILPVLLLSWESSSHVARVARAHILEALNEDYIFTARAKGLREQKVVLSHALRNALVPTVTILGLQFGTLLGGTLILESIFGLPGLGRGLVQAALVRDFPVIQTLVTVLVFLILTLNLMIDLAYGILDPRIHISHTGHALYSHDARRGATVR